jgi:hypothetical protein
MMLKTTATVKGVAIYFVILPSIVHTDQAQILTFSAMFLIDACTRRLCKHSRNAVAFTILHLVQF